MCVCGVGDVKARIMDTYAKGLWSKMDWAELRHGEAGGRNYLVKAIITTALRMSAVSEQKRRSANAVTAPQRDVMKWKPMFLFTKWSELQNQRVDLQCVEATAEQRGADVALTVDVAKTNALPWVLLQLALTGILTANFTPECRHTCLRTVSDHVANA